MHGFLILKSEDGKVIAVGDQIDRVRGDEIDSRLVFHFRDGSIDDELATYRQDSMFHLVHDHHVQTGPSFPKAVDMTVDVPSGQVAWKQTKDGKTETKQEHVDLPDDLVNGMVSLVVENFPAHGQMKVSYLVVDSKPRVIKLAIWPDGEDKTLIADSDRLAHRFNVHIELGGVTGAIARMIGKQPPDFKLWTLDGEDVPVFVKMVGALYENGPIWTMLLAAPRWPSEVSDK